MFKSTFFLLISLMALPNVLAQTVQQRPLVTVSGQAEVMVVPDEVVFNVKASALDKDLLKARSRTDEVVKKVIALAKSYGIPPELVQTDYISLDERYSDEEATRKPSVFLGYAVEKKVAISLRDVSKAERFLSELFSAGITSIQSVEFRTTQNRKYRDQARALAIKAAQEKATAYARELGQTIGKAYSITEEGLPNYATYSNTMNVSRGVVGSYSEEPSTIALGQISITARVLVSFELQ